MSLSKVGFGMLFWIWRGGRNGPGRWGEEENIEAWGKEEERLEDGRMVDLCWICGFVSCLFVVLFLLYTHVPF